MDRLSSMTFRVPPEIYRDYITSAEKRANPCADPLCLLLHNISLALDFDVIKITSCARFRFASISAKS